MATSPEGFRQRSQDLKARLVEQGRRVQDLIELAFEAAFDRSAEKAQRVTKLDDAIDTADVEIERAAVQLLTDATRETAQLDENQLRLVLTIVKVNNELERIADVGVAIAEECRLFNSATDLPPTFRVMANSVVGIIRDCVSSLDRLDPELSRVVLLSEEAILEFKKRLVAETQKKLQAGSLSVDVCSTLHDVAMQCVTSADHCTNIAEQVMYTSTGKIVRHMDGRWEEVILADPTPPGT